MTDFGTYSATGLLAGYRTGRFSPVEVVESLASAIEQVDPLLNSFAAFDRDAAIAAARDAASLYAAGASDLPPLLGLPVAVKDLIDTADLPTAYGSRHHAGHRPQRDAEVVRRLRAAGAIVLGKTATHEYAWGFTTANPHYGPTRNPWDLDRVPGGSSGGNGAALAAGLAPLAIGTDTGGSIRVPAAFCGVCGHKPTHGLIYATGVFPLAPSLDHVGPMARDPADLALAMEALVGVRTDLSKGLNGLRIGISEELHAPAPSPAIQAVWDHACRRLADAGAVLVPLLPIGLTDLASVFGRTLLPEALEVHRAAGLFPAERGLYGEDVAVRLSMAEALTSEDLAEARRRRAEIVVALAAAFAGVDLVASLVSADPPPRIDEILGPLADPAADPRHSVIGYTALADLTGFPATALRAGFDDRGLPVGLQFMARRGDDAAALSAAKALFDATPDVQAARPDPSLWSRRS